MTESPYVADREKRKRKALAATFVPDERFERLVEESAGGKIVLPPALRLSLGYYKRAKAAHDATTGEEQE